MRRVVNMSKGKITKDEIIKIIIYVMITFVGISISDAITESFNISIKIKLLIAAIILLILAYLGNIKEYI